MYLHRNRSASLNCCAWQEQQRMDVDVEKGDDTAQENQPPKSSLCSR